MKTSNVILGGLAVVGVSILSYRKGYITALEDVCKALILDDQKRKARKKLRVDEYIFETRSEAEDVLCCLTDTIEAYGIATVADLKGLIGVPSTFTDNCYGWTDLRNAYVKRVRSEACSKVVDYYHYNPSGYKLYLPDAKKIN